MENIIENTPDVPPPLIANKKEKIRNKLNEKNYLLNFENNQYKLIISLFEEESNKEEKFFNFKLSDAKNKIEVNNNFYYENNKNSSELISLFLINPSKSNNPAQIILDKIEKFHLNNNATLQKKNDSQDTLELLYTLKTLDNEELVFKIELYKKEIISDLKNDVNLIEEITFLKNYVKNMEEKYEKIIKEQNNEIKSLKGKIENLMGVINSNKNNKLLNEEQQINFKSDLLTLNNIKIINADIDGGRGVNDLFEVYNLYNDKKTVYLAVKVKEENKDISYLDIFKMTSIDNIKKNRNKLRKINDATINI